MNREWSEEYMKMEIAAVKDSKKKTVDRWRKYSVRTTNLKHKPMQCVQCGVKKVDGVDPHAWMWRRLQAPGSIRMPITQSLCPTCTKLERG